MCLDCAKHFTDSHAESIGHTGDQGEGGIAATSFDAAHVGPIDAGVGSQAFLGDAALLAQLSNHYSERFR